MVTVIIPAYNRPDDLRQALKSLEIQTEKDFKVIVSDDGGAIDLNEVCKEFGALDITYIRRATNGGCGANRNFAMEYFYQHPTEYVMFLDSDDLLMPQCIARLTLAISNNEADIICTDIVKESTGPVQEQIKADLARTWCHGKVYRTQFLMDHHLQFNKKLRTNEDLGFNLAVYAHKPESYILNEALYLWRANPDSITRSKNMTEAQQKCGSIDYINAIYQAFLEYDDNMLLSAQMIGNILNCYTYYQNAKIFGLLTTRITEIMRKMLHREEVERGLVNIYSMPEIDLRLKQWVVKQDNLVFYGQTFGSWIMEFFTPADIKNLIDKYQLREK